MNILNIKICFQENVKEMPIHKWFGGKVIEINEEYVERKLKKQRIVDQIKTLKEQLKQLEKQLSSIPKE